MTREIKFRAYQSQEKKMYYQGDAADENRKLFWKIWETKSHISEPMQFTGIEDKNGKEIYEGDIVNVVGTKRIGSYVTEIIYYHSGFVLKENLTYLVDSRAINKLSCEVIGNIHENPELLNK